MTEEHKPKLHVLFTKEEVGSDKLGAGKVAVVFDVLLATSTISTLLHYGAKEIIPVLNAVEALSKFDSLDESMTILTGEVGGQTIEGFFDPLPTKLKDSVKGKTVVLSTTNGTVAILKVAKAEQVYAGSLLNAQAIAQKIVTEHVDYSVLAVCAGSGGRFSMEDFYGAGCFINEMVCRSEAWELTDSAKAALYFYRCNEERAAELLVASGTGEMMVKAGLSEEVLFAAQKGSIPIVPQLEEGKMIVKMV